MFKLEFVRNKEWFKDEVLQYSSKMYAFYELTTLFRTLLVRVALLFLI